MAGPANRGRDSRSRAGAVSRRPDSNSRCYPPCIASRGALRGRWPAAAQPRRACAPGCEGAGSRRRACLKGRLRQHSERRPAAVGGIQRAGALSWHFKPASRPGRASGRWVCRLGRSELPVRRPTFPRWASGTINPMKPSDSFRVHREALREIIARHGVTRPRVFGSAARGEDHDGSDLDLLVEPASTTTLFTLAALQIEAERLLGVSVDVLTPRSLPRGSRERILREAVPV